MGKGGKARDAEQAREYQLRRKQAEEEEKKRQNRAFLRGVLALLALFVIGGAVVLVTVLVNGREKKPETDGITAQESNAPSMDSLDFSEVTDGNLFTASEEQTDYVKLNVSYTDSTGAAKTGDIVIRLFDEVAPITVKNFKSLVSNGTYNGLTFHRVYSGFMIQGGDPSGNGSGGTAAIKGEFTSNGYRNNLSHVRGVVSMARSLSDNDSGSSQFFIVHKDTLSLDGDYASFGYVVYGMDTVDGIAGTEVAANAYGEKSAPTHPVTINSASFVSLSNS